MSEGINPPNRDRFRQERAERRRIQKAERRRKLIGVPLVLLGISLIAAGAYVFVNNGDDAPLPGSEVGGTSIVREATTVPPTVETEVATDPAVTADTADAGLGETIPVVGSDAGDDAGAETTVP